MRVSPRGPSLQRRAAPPPRIESITFRTMATDTEHAGFLSRWSRRKAQVRQGVVAAEAPVTAAARTAPPAVPAAAAPVLPPADMPAPEAASEAAPAPPPPTLADVAALTHDSDYSRFVGHGVQPEVRNAALGKLFSDPRFNVMDGLDTYIDDYGKPDPLPAGMLRQLLQSHGLGLFDGEEQPPLPANPAPPAAAAPLPTDPAADENPDLQLQPDDPAGCAGTAPGAGEDAGRAH
jgi:hypothetical protein